MKRDNLIQSVRETVGRGTRTFERMVEVCGVGFSVPSQDDEAGDSDEE